MKNRFFCLPLVFLLIVVSVVDGQTTFWERVDGIRGGDIEALVVLSNGDVVAATYDLGVYISRDQGASWVFISNGLAVEYVFGLSVGKNDTIYAATSDGIWRTGDRGQHWEALGTSAIGSMWFYCVVEAQDGDLYAGSWNDGIFKSSDHGTTWSAINTGLTNLGVQTIDFHSSGALFIGTAGGGVFRSTDQGATWSAVNNGAEASGDVEALLITPSGTIFAAYLYNGVYRSADSGDHWTHVGDGIVYEPQVLLLTPNGQVYVGTNGNGVYHSADNGDTWVAINDGLWARDICTLATDGNKIWVGTYYGGIYSSADQGTHWTWHARSPGYPRISTIVFDSLAGDIFVGTRDMGLLKSEDGGETWVPASNGLPMTTIENLIVAPNGQLLTFQSGYGLYHSTNRGENWSWLENNLLYSDFDVMGVNASGNTILMGTSWGYIARSTDFGVTWTRADSGIGEVAIQCFGSDANGSILVGTSYGVFRSRDNGDTWQQLDDTFQEDVVCVAAGGNDNIFVGTRANGIFHYDGQTWKNCLAGNVAFQIHTLLIDRRGTVYAGTQTGGVLVSSDNGATWTGYNDGLVGDEVQVLVFDAKGYLWAGTYDLGLFKSHSMVNTGVRANAHSSTPMMFQLGQNYPNPFNPVTTIRFAVKEACQVVLTIHDVTGRQVAVLTRRAYQPGTYQVDFDAHDLPSAVYYYRIRMKDFEAVKKMLLIR